MISFASLLDALRHGPLLPPAQLEEAERLTRSLPSPQAVVTELASRNWLTEYQSKELSRGLGMSLALGPYVLLEKLGGGGMGEVFRARHRLMDRPAAVKRMLPSLGDDPEFIDRFVREAKLAARLSHENVVRIYDFNEVGGTYYLAMEYLHGVTLAEELKARFRLPVADAVEAVRQACLGMQHAHEHGIVHRDLKPGNLMRVERDRVKVLDLGMAVAANVTRWTSARDFCGTAAYSAPEQARDASKVDVRADVYSLGCTLYHLLSGRTPFLDTEAVVQLAKHASSEEPPPLERLYPDLPSPVSAVVRKMMAKQPEKRYQTPGEAAAALAAFQRFWGGSNVPVTLGGAATTVWRSPDTQPPGRAPDSGGVEAAAAPTPPLAAPQRLLNSIGMKFVLVNPGKFLMGSPPSEADRRGDERQHEVTISRPFYLGAFPVTQGQWRAVMGSNPSHFSRTGAGKEKVKDVSDVDLDRFPVESVGWEDVQEFLRRLAALKEEAKNRREYRLPSEAEWEYACRGGHLTQDAKEAQALPFHSDRPTRALSSTEANFMGNDPTGRAKAGPYLERPSKVGSYKANVLGLHDMHGNVWEWCADWYGDYPTAAATDPQGPSRGSQRVSRGGSWKRPRQDCRAAYRGVNVPSSRYDDLGFRVVAVVRDEG